MRLKEKHLIKKTIKVSFGVFTVFLIVLLMTAGIKQYIDKKKIEKQLVTNNIIERIEGVKAEETDTMTSVDNEVSAVGMTEAEVKHLVRDMVDDSYKEIEKENVQERIVEKTEIITVEPVENEETLSLIEKTKDYLDEKIEKLKGDNRNIGNNIEITEDNLMDEIDERERSITNIFNTKNENLVKDVDNLKTEVDNNFNILKNNTNNSFTMVENKITNTESKLTEKIVNTEADLIGRITNTENELNQKITDSELGLGERLNNAVTDLGEKITSAVSSLKERIINAENGLGDRITSTELDLGERINNAENGLGERITNTENGLGERINNAEHGLGERITNTENGLGERISSAVSGLGEKIANTESDLDAKIANVGDNLGERITNTETTFKEQMANSETKFGEQLSNVETNFGDRINNLGSDLGNQITNVEKKWGDKFDTLEGGFGDKLSIFEANFKKEITEIKNNMQALNASNVNFNNSMLIKVDKKLASTDVQGAIDSLGKYVSDGKINLANTITNPQYAGGVMTIADTTNHIPTFKELEDGIKSIYTNAYAKGLAEGMSKNEDADIEYFYHHHVNNKGSLTGSSDNCSYCKAGKYDRCNHFKAAMQASQLGGCYTKPVYHVHLAECKTLEDYTYTCEGRLVNGGCDERNGGYCRGHDGGWIHTYCNVCGEGWGHYNGDEGDICGALKEGKREKYICGKTENTIEGYLTDCGFGENAVCGATVIFN